MTDCANKKRNSQDCNCTYSGCDKHGVCCECIRYHRNRGELPACYFSKDVEKTWDRSITKFISENS